jgi:hypothetical protein
MVRGAVLCGAAVPMILGLWIQYRRRLYHRTGTLIMRSADHASSVSPLPKLASSSSAHDDHALKRSVGSQDRLLGVGPVTEDDVCQAGGSEWRPGTAGVAPIVRDQVCSLCVSLSLVCAHCGW